MDEEEELGEKYPIDEQVGLGLVTRKALTA